MLTRLPLVRGLYLSNLPTLQNTTQASSLILRVQRKLRPLAGNVSGEDIADDDAVEVDGVMDVAMAANGDRNLA